MTTNTMPSHVAPTNELEIELVSLCIEKLGLTFGEFWYKWFSSSSVLATGNHTIHINSNQRIKLDTLRAEFSKLPFFVKMLRLNEIDIHKLYEGQSIEEVEFRYQYFIHFKSNLFIESKPYN
jgi:hypothetical protein